MMMKELRIEDLNNFSINGLRQICSHNRHCLYSFSNKPRRDIIEIFQKRLNENCIILIPPYVYKDSQYLLSQYKVM